MCFGSRPTQPAPRGRYKSGWKFSFQFTMDNIQFIWVSQSVTLDSTGLDSRNCDIIILLVIVVLIAFQFIFAVVIFQLQALNIASFRPTKPSRLHVLEK